jgi:hypothetical protein
LDAAKIGDEAVDPISGQSVRLGVVGLLAEKLITPNWHVALTGKFVGRLSIYDLEDFCLRKSTSMLDRYAGEIRHLHDQVWCDHSVSTGIGSMARFAEMREERGTGLLARVLGFWWIRACAQHPGDPNQKNPR